ncbi:hypothetical protein EDB19DRAFT_1835430 [Suillus lakei]|nr:hypothetical protein EDB19DRAFT_1835430 [Suillus lakei]
MILHLPNPKARGRSKDKEIGGTVFKVPALSAKQTNHAPDADVFERIGAKDAFWRTLLFSEPQLLKELMLSLILDDVEAFSAEVALQREGPRFTRTIRVLGTRKPSLRVTATYTQRPSMVVIIDHANDYPVYKHASGTGSPHLNEDTVFVHFPLDHLQAGRACGSVWDASVWGDRGVSDPLPRLHIDGLWYGSPYIELAETIDIQNSTSWLSTIEYKRKVYFLGQVAHVESDADPTYAPSHYSSHSHSGVAFHDTPSPKDEITVAPVEEQGE